MIWLTWRQFRVQAWVTAATLAALAIALAVTGVGLAHLYDASGAGVCHASGDCGRAAANFLAAAHNSQIDNAVYYLGLGLLFVVPALIGIFWGAPLLTREFETGTYRLAWNQSVTRSRWLAAKLGLTGLAATVTAALISLMTGWWASPIYRAAGLAETRNGAAVVDRLTPLQFGAGGLVPVGYAAFALALGVAAGVMIRRTVPAMALTLAIFAAMQVITPLWLRPRFMTPLASSTPLNPATIGGMQFGDRTMTVFAGVSKSGIWVLSNRVTHADGRVFTGPPPKACESGSFQACQAALGRLHLRQLLTYQPAGRYWDFQWIETGLFLALALALAGPWSGRPRLGRLACRAGARRPPRRGRDGPPARERRPASRRRPTPGRDRGPASRRRRPAGG